jgi:hypothetical protein
MQNFNVYLKNLIQTNLQCTGSGSLSHHLNGEPVEADQAWKSNIQHVHEKCIEQYVPVNCHDISERTYTFYFS